MSNKDQIEIIWHIDDVKEVAPEVTDDEAREVLRLVNKEHDAEIGVSWDTLRYWASYVIGERKEEHGNND